MKYEPGDRWATLRNAASFAASLFVHALIAYFLFSLATSSSEQFSPESFSGSVVLTVSRQLPRKASPVKLAQVAAPVVRAPAAAHPRAPHELSKFAPTAPPNPTPAPVRSTEPRPAVPTVAPLAVTPLPVALTAPSPKLQPTAEPSAAPKAKPVPSPEPEPSALIATEAPIVALAAPQPLSHPETPSQVKIAKPVATPGRAAASPAPKAAGSPGSKAVGSPGPKGAAPVKSPALARPVQTLPATPRPAPVSPLRASGRGTFGRRLQSLIPTAAPSFTPAPPKRYSFLTNLKPTPEPEPTPPPSVIAATKYLYVENVGSERWKQSILGTAPEENYVKMYVTSVKRIGFVHWCTGWVLRAPLAGNSKWIVEENESLICGGRLQPFAQGSPQPAGGS